MLTFNCFCHKGLDFWRAPHKVGLAVDIHVTGRAYRILAKMLKKKKIKNQILIFDVGKLMDEQNAIQKRGLAQSFYSKYHPLNEVIRSLLNRRSVNVKVTSILLDVINTI